MVNSRTCTSSFLSDKMSDDFLFNFFVCYRGGRDGAVCWHGGMCHIWKSGWHCDETIDMTHL